MRHAWPLDGNATGQVKEEKEISSYLPETALQSVDCEETTTPQPWRRAGLTKVMPHLQLMKISNKRRTCIAIVGHRVRLVKSLIKEQSVLIHI